MEFTARSADSIEGPTIQIEVILLLLKKKSRIFGHRMHVTGEHKNVQLTIINRNPFER